MTDGANAGAAIDDGAIVVAHAQVGFAGVEGYANPQRPVGWPGLGRQVTLDVDGRGDGVGRLRENGKAAIPLAPRPDVYAAVLLDATVYQNVMEQ